MEPGEVTREAWGVRHGHRGCQIACCLLARLGRRRSLIACWRVVMDFPCFGGCICAPVNEREMQDARFGELDMKS